MIYLPNIVFQSGLDLNIECQTQGFVRSGAPALPAPMHQGKLVFSQIMAHLPLSTLRRCVADHRGDHKVQDFTCLDQFFAMAFAQLTYRESLRDIEIHLRARSTRLYHMGFRCTTISRNTLANANATRPWQIYADLARHLIGIARPLYAGEALAIELEATVYAFDATTIDLCLSVFPWAPFHSTKAAIKLHTLLDLRGNILAFIHISDGKMGDVKALDVLPIKSGAYYVMDRGYADFARLYKLHQAGAFFVTRAKPGMNARQVYSAPVDRTSGIICDQRIALNGHYVRKDYPEHLRRVRFKDPKTGKTLVFLTNNTNLPALSIAALYQSRWQVELFFKWIKQHLRIKRFLGTSENAVKTKIWCAVCTYVLIAIVKKELHLSASLYSCLQILSVSVFEKTQLIRALQPDASKTSEPPSLSS
jgi:hypothetical protein